ncbi:hypothetical protein BKA62DRAFT_672578 [Auriculariales sp. MPI-PUGE-AT-0066]|nr:hypothetical protein BKA62DRAFT_672578 [Auriculariales sp. MPI-PUGE-AT-0066]
MRFSLQDWLQSMAMGGPFGLLWWIRQVFLAATSAGYISVLAYNGSQIRVTSEPLPKILPGFKLCWCTNLTKVAWALCPTIVCEVVLFCALVHKVLRQLKEDHGSYGFGRHIKKACSGCRLRRNDCNFQRARRTLLHLILRDNLISFVIVIVLLISEALMWSVLTLPESQLIDSPTIAIISILSSRMLLNVRKEGRRNKTVQMGTLTAAADAMLSCPASPDGPEQPCEVPMTSPTDWGDLIRVRTFGLITESRRRRPERRDFPAASMPEPPSPSNIGPATSDWCLSNIQSPADEQTVANITAFGHTKTHRLSGWSGRWNGQPRVPAADGEDCDSARQVMLERYRRACGGPENEQRRPFQHVLALETTLAALRLAPTAA